MHVSALRERERERERERGGGGLNRGIEPQKLKEEADRLIYIKEMEDYVATVAVG